jgi:DNA-binding transcriptional ArsR family regulator
MPNRGREGEPEAEAGQGSIDQGVKGLSQLLRLLSEETRLKILYVLAEGERDVTGLWGPMRLPQATVSHHLSFLRLAGLVSTRRAGKHIHYRLGPGARSAGPGVLAIQCPDFALRLEVRGAGERSGPPNTADSECIAESEPESAISRIEDSGDDDTR